MDYKNFALDLYKHLQTTPLFLTMEQTVENSPWHREANVLVHTTMVLDEYCKLISAREWTREDVLGYLAAMFHDTGKPAARVEKFKPERGYYNSFGGHELISARLWEDWAVSNWDKLSDLGIAPEMIYAVGFLIEHHLPYDVKDATKRKAFARTMINMFSDVTVFERVLRADTWGRISDDHVIKKANVEGWLERFTPLYEEVACDAELIEASKTVYILVGPSGCGKSTLITTMAEPGDITFSWDRLRLEWYGDTNEIDLKKQYRGAFERANEDNDFMNKANAEFTKIVKANKDKQNIFVDNTNLSAKRRRYFVDQARRNGYRVTGVVLPINLDTLKHRRLARHDKTVPEEALIKHFMGVQLPLYGEVDDVFVTRGNLIHGA